MIPVCKLIRFGNGIGYVNYDAQNNRFMDWYTDKDIERDLPVQDVMSCEVSSNGIATLVGKARDKFVICFGDNMLYSVEQKQLASYSMSNVEYIKNNKIRSIDGELEDLGYLFPDKNIEYLEILNSYQQTSLGVARKFKAKYKGKDCIIKFSKTDGKDIINERTYYEISNILEIPCCEAIISKYNGKVCIVSIFEYDKNKDIFKSFRNINTKVSEILNSLSSKDRYIFDRMLLLDFILSQQDRHMSNMATCNGEIYPLFDNGECLGIGTIGMFSLSHRKYILSLDKEYVNRLLNRDIQQFLTELNKVKFYDREKCINIIAGNLEEVGIW